MSAISLKSITGITSITTPTGVDNQLTLHNNNTTEAVKLDVAGNLHFHNHLNITGVSTASNFKTGTSNLHNTGLNVFDLDVDGHTNLDNVSIAGVTTVANTLTFNDNVYARFGTDGDASLWHDNSHLRFNNGTGNFNIQSNDFQITDSSNTTLRFRVDADGPTYIRYNGLDRLITSNAGVSFPRDIDVDGHTNLDNVSVAGVTTITGASGTLLQVSHTAGSGGQAIIKTKATQANSSSFIRAEDSGSTYIGLLKYGTGHSAYGALGAGDGALYANSADGNDTNITIMADSSTGYINFATGGNTERLRINSSGQVSLGNNPTVASDAALHIELDGSREYLRLNADAGNNNAYIEIQADDNRRKALIFKSGGTRRGVIGVGDSDEASATSLFFSASSNIAGNSPHMVITSDGQIGVNQASPKAWHSSYRSIQIHNGASLYGSSDVSFVGLGANHYLNTSGNFIYSNTDFASRFYQVNGEFYFEGAPSSNAGNTFSFTQRLRITSTGQIRIDQATSANNGIRMRPSGWNYDFRMGAVSSSGGSIWLGQNYDPTSGAKDSSSYGTNYLRFTTNGEIMLGTGPANTTPTERLKITNAGKIGINEDNPQTTLNVRGCISTGRNVAREVGTIIDISSSYSGSRNGISVINGQKNYEENPNADWITANGQRVNANLTIDLGAQYTCDRFVIYNQNEYTNNVREVKHFTLEGSNDKSSWTTLLDDECGASYAAEPNPGFSFRIPASFLDDDEGATYRYWRFTMKDYHGSTTLGGVMELELYEVDSSNRTISEISTHHLSAQDITAQTIYHDLPAFFACKTSSLSISNQTNTVLAFTTDQGSGFDTNGYYNNSNYKFNPKIPGYYQINMCCSVSYGALQAGQIWIYKNGSAYAFSQLYLNGGESYDDICLTISTLVHLDGQNDYLEARAWRNGGNGGLGSGFYDQNWSGYLVRHAGYRRHGDGV